MWLRNHCKQVNSFFFNRGFTIGIIDINISENFVTVTATKSEEKEQDTANYYRRERFMGKVQRSTRLPVDADHQRAEASFEQGVLTIKFPNLAGQAGTMKLQIT